MNIINHKKESIRVPSTMREIAQVVPYKEVALALDYHYPDEKGRKHINHGAYKRIYKWLATVQKRAHRDKDEFIEVLLNDGLFWGPDDTDQYHTIHTNKFSMSFRSWRLLANIEIADATLTNHTRAELAAFFLWEITFYGYTEKAMDKIGKQILKSKKEAVKMIKAGKL